MAIDRTKKSAIEHHVRRQGPPYRKVVTRTTNVPAIIYDFKAIGAALRKQRIDDWWQPAKPEPEPKSAEFIAREDGLDPFGRFNWEGWAP
jgi:hypothetical protein